MTMTTLPHWNMTVLYPGLEAQEFQFDFAALREAIIELGTLFDQYEVGKRSSTELDDNLVATFEDLLNRYNDLLARTSTMRSYIYSFVATDSRDDLAQARMSELQQQLVRLSQLGTRWTAWLGSLDVDGLIARSALAREHSFVLQRAKQEAVHLMSPAEEEMAAELGLTGGTAWAKLHGNLASQLTVPVEQQGQTVPMPMSMVRNLAFEADRDLRRRGYEAELGGWKTVAVPLAAALNSIKGEVGTLARRRGWADPLEAALFVNNIDRQTLDAMMLAARESFPDFRRYLQAKAHALAVPSLAWYDMFAPVGKISKVWEYDETADFITTHFGSYSSKLRDFAARAFREGWIDAEPRPGKRDGAFCMHLRGDESRILANFKPVFSGMSTLAHELGHGYHNLALAGRTMLQHDTPMTLAETASIFCQTIVNHAALAESDREEQIAILEESLQDACQIVVDISSRFLFEQRLFETRQQRELSVDELNDLMLQTQRETYGEGLDEQTLHPYMWAVKGHYYSTARSFYNYPYMFGLLFGLGLYARYQQDPAAFRASYDDLLSSTGLADAATLAKRFDIDVRTPDFWRASLDIVRADIHRFEALVRV